MYLMPNCSVVSNPLRLLEQVEKFLPVRKRAIVLAQYQSLDGAGILFFNICCLHADFEGSHVYKMGDGLPFHRSWIIFSSLVAALLEILLWMTQRSVSSTTLCV